MAPVEFPNPIVSVEWLAEHGDDVQIIDVRSYLDGRSGQDAWNAGHIPGSYWVSLDNQLSAPVGPTGGRHPLPDPDAFASVMSELGVSDSTHVVVYDDVGGAMAGRLWWMLDATGHHVAVLDGGLDAWTSAGHPLTTDSTPPTVGSFTATPWPPDLLVSADEVAERINTDTVILDARSNPRFRGEEFPVDPRYGHIPSARSAPALANMDPSTGRFESIDEARTRYASVGAIDAPEVVVYCGSGVTACADLLQLKRLGVTGRLYVGSWSEWGADHDRPLETGDSDG